MAEFEGFTSFREYLENEGDVSPRGGDVTIGDYALDVVKGTGKGLTQAVEGLLQLGAIPIDLALDSNISKTIQQVFDKITPETATSVGDITSTLVQFGVPGGAALKVAGGISKLKGLSTMTKLSSLPTRTSKGAELVKRAGYFGGIGGITDLAVSTPGSIETLSENLGLVEKTSLEGLEGRERAAELLKAKIKFGAEGTVLGAGVTLLPTAGMLGVKYGLLPASKAVGYVGGKMLRAVDAPVTQFSKMIGGTKFGDDVSSIQKAISKTGGLIDKGMAKTGLPDNKDFRFLPAEGGFKSTVLKGLRRFQDQFTTSGALSPEIKGIQTKVLNQISAEKKTVERLADQILEKQSDLVKEYKFKLFDKGESSNMIQYENNKVLNFLKSYKGSTAYKNYLKEINPELRGKVLELRNVIDKQRAKYKNFLEETFTDNDPFVQDFSYFANQRLGAFKNPKFKFDPTREKKAVNFFKERLKNNPEMRVNVTKLAKEKNISFDKALDLAAKNEMLSLKNLVINSNAQVQTIFKQVAEKTGVTLKEGETFDDRITDLFSKEKDAFIIKNGKKTDVVTSDFKSAALDTVINQSERMYGRRAFDYILKDGLDKGFIFPKGGAALRGVDDSKLIDIRRPDRDIPDDLATSELFTGGFRTNKEVANAIIGAEEALGSLYNLPFYKGIMQLKAGAQIAKTILSPMTQIRNFTTAAFFPLASGILGGKAKFSDAFKIVADDIFRGAASDADKIARIENLISRGVIDQNIQVQEIKKILDKAQQGGLNFNTAMESKIMRKLTDVYQGSDNIYKIYADDFYQGALKQAFGVDPKTFRDLPKARRVVQEKKFMDQVKDWYRTVAKEEFVETNVLTGGKKTPEEALEEISAYLTTNTIPTYSKVPEIIKNIRNLPFGNFIAFPAEILRTTSNIISLGARELTSSNPFIRQMGARRLIGVTTVLGGIGKVVQETAEYVTGVDPETMDAFQRSFAPTYQQNSTLIPLTAPDKDGKFKYYNFSYSNPYDSLITPVNAILGAYQDGRLNQDTEGTIVMNALFGGILGGDGRRGAVTEFLSPFVSESIGTERAVDVTLRRGKTVDGKQIFFEQDSPSVKISKSLEHVLGGLTPGAVTSAQRVWDGASGQFTDYGTVRDGYTELAALLSGVRVEEAKPLASMPFIITSYNRDKRSIAREFGARAYSARTSPEEKLGAFKEYVLDNFKNQKAMYTTLQDAKQLGIDEDLLDDEFKKRRMTRTERKTLMDGEFKAPTFSKKAFDTLVERASREDPFAAARLERESETVQEIFEEMQDAVREFDLRRPLEELDNYLEQILSPPTQRVRAQGRPTPFDPAPSLPSNISGQPVSPGIVSLGQRFLGVGGQQNVLRDVETDKLLGVR